MKKIVYTIIVTFFLLIIGYMYWSKYDRVVNTENIYPRYVIGNLETYGKNSGKGNVVALSPYLHTYDFSSEDAFYKMLHYYLDLAKRKNMFNDSTILVLPEYMGAWLVAVNEKKSVYSDTTLKEGMNAIVLSNLGKFGLAYLRSHSEDRTKEAVFRMKSEKMLDIYQQTFSGLSKEFKITIVAGSIVLPGPTVKNGRIVIDKNGKLYNISAVFDRNGKVITPLTKKIYPVDEEKSFTCCADIKEIPVYKTPPGNLAVLICADAWYAGNYQLLKKIKADILAVPSFVEGENDWDLKWKGYNGAATPDDVIKSDIGKITEREAWLKYAMCGRAGSANIRTGVNTFLRGDLWNMGTDGHTLIWKNDLPMETKDVRDKTGTLINVWLE